MTPAEARRAVYLDFEGNIGMAPTLAGVVYAESDNPDAMPMLHQLIIESAFDSCARRRGTSHVHAWTVSRLLAWLRALITTEGRLLVSWSEHDLEMLRQLCTSEDTTDMVGAFEAAHRNARTIAVSWLWHTQGTRLGRGHNGLDDYRSLFQLAVPEAFGPGLVGEALRQVRTAIQRRGGYGALTSAQRASWKAIVRHNEFDCCHTRQMIEQMCMDLE